MTQSKNKRQEDLSKKLGDLLLLTHNSYIEDLVSTTKRMGDYIITVAVESDDGKHTFKEGDLKWTTPESWGMMHFEAMILDRDYKMFIPDLLVRAKVYDSNKNLVGEADAEYIWHPYAQHYGFDLKIEEEGKYFVELTIEEPEFSRMYKVIGKRYLDKITVRMEALNIYPAGKDDQEELFPKNED